MAAEYGVCEHGSVLKRNWMQCDPDAPAVTRNDGMPVGQAYVSFAAIEVVGSQLVGDPKPARFTALIPMIQGPPRDTTVPVLQPLPHWPSSVCQCQFPAMCVGPC